MHGGEGPVRAAAVGLAKGVLLLRHGGRAGFHRAGQVRSTGFAQVFPVFHAFCQTRAAPDLALRRSNWPPRASSMVPMGCDHIRSTT
jgi:hypothetical protein